MATDGPTPTMLGLPVELQQDIISKTDRRDVLPVRQVCRELCAAAHDQYLNTFFTRRRHLITRHGLACLVSISENVRLRSKPKEIELVAVDLLEEIAPAYLVSRAHWRTSAFGLTEAEKVLQAEYDRKKDAQDTAAWNAWEIERDSLLESGYGLSLLSKALSNFAAIGIRPMLEVTRNINLLDLVFGCRQLTRDLTGEELPRWTIPYFDHRKMVNGALPLVLSAVKEAQLQLSGLLVGQLHNGARCNYAPFQALGPKIVEFNICVGSLHSLTLYLDKLWDAENEGGFMCLSEMLKAASSLEDVKLDFEHHAHIGGIGRCISKFANVFRHHKLRNVSLREVTCFTQELYDFFAHDSDTLVDLELIRVTIPEPEKWQPIFVWLAEKLRLKRAYIDTVYHANYSQALKHHPDNYSSIRYHHFQGLQGVAAGLHDLAQVANFTTLDELMTDNDDFLDEEDFSEEEDFSDAEDLLEEEEEEEEEDSDEDEAGDREEDQAVES